MQPYQQDVPKWATDGEWWEGGKFIDPGADFETRRLETPQDRKKRSTAGRRSRTRTTRKRGRYVRSHPSPRDPSDLAFDATLRAAAPHQRGRGAEEAHGPALHLQPQDYHKKVRVRRAANLILFMVDASWSMAVSERMEATKGAILSLLTDAYQRRDRVGMIVFQKDRATLVLPPTNSVELAKKQLVNLPVGGKTPLAAGLWLALQTIEREMRRYPELMPMMVILTDGAGNVSMGDRPPQEEAYRIADRIKEEPIKSIVVNMEAADYDRGLARELADHMGGICHNLASLHADSLLSMVRRELSTH
jgi:magnesium chelatase subunit D